MSDASQIEKTPFMDAPRESKDPADGGFGSPWRRAGMIGVGTPSFSVPGEGFSVCDKSMMAILKMTHHCGVPNQVRLCLSALQYLLSLVMVLKM